MELLRRGYNGVIKKGKNGVVEKGVGWSYYEGGRG